MLRTKPKRVYHLGMDKYGDVLGIVDGWVTVRMDGEVGTRVYEPDAPYIMVFMDKEDKDV